MAKTSELTVAKRAQIVLLASQKVSQRNIAKQLKCSRCAVQTTLSRHAESGSYENRAKSGRKRATTPREDRFLERASLKNRRKTAKELRADLKKGLGVDISQRTVSRRLQSLGLHGRKARKKPLLNKNQIKKRLDFAKKYKDWTVEDWSKVIWSDESNIEVRILHCL